MTTTEEAAARAVEVIEERAVAARPAAEARLDRILGLEATDRLVSAIRSDRGFGPVTLNFHPDRVAAGGASVASGLAEQGRYRSQWVTWISNGGRSALAGGARNHWERTLFGGAYEGCDPARVDHPVYGAADLLSDPFGGSPRFGSCHLVLGSEVAARTTLCLGDSHLGPTDVGTVAEPHALLAGLAEQAADGRLLGRPLGLDDLRRALAGRPVTDGPGRELDHYVEAQVHGGVDLGRDAIAVVADPSFRDTDVESDLARMAEGHGLELRWHTGSILAVADVPDDFRGPTMPGLARQVAGGRPTIDAAAIGRAAAGIQAEPPTATGDPEDSDRQQLKKLWHVVLALGSPADGGVLDRSDPAGRY